MSAQNLGLFAIACISMSWIRKPGQWVIVVQCMGLRRRDGHRAEATVRSRSSSEGNYDVYAICLISQT